MKASMYFNYTSRSLIRGGQRTVLAIFCVAVGVMAIVALQLVGQMINNSLTSNVRDANGGDISVNASLSLPFKQSDLSFFDNLKSQGTIANYTASINANGSTGVAASATNSFNVVVVDPSTFPLVTPPSFVNPSNGSLSSSLTNDQVIIDQNLANQYNKKVGDSITVHVNSQNSAAIILKVKIVGIVNDSGVFAQLNDFMVISLTDYKAAAPNLPLLYNAIYISTNQNQALTDKATKAIEDHFPNATTTTAAAALKNNQDQVDFIKKFLDIAGLLALLIGGVGIVNTMQVLLSRRRIEIAMLKTTGYRRYDLYLLFGLEAGLLGFVGGVVGAAAAVGVSYVVRNLVIQVFQISIPFLLDPVIIGGGILIGLFTALIFGLLPIVQAANIRPLNVIRELPGSNRFGSVFLTIVLLLLLSVLFCIMAGVILNDTILAISAVYGTFVFLALLSLLFALVVLAISSLPVPERFSFVYLALILVSVAISIAIFVLLPAFGTFAGLLFVVSLLGIVIVVLPRSWKVSTKMALRNIGRQRARTTTTLLALFVGVFTIGLILVLGLDLRDNINNALAKSLTFNLVAITRGKDTAALQSKVSSIPGLSHSEQRAIASVAPVSIDGVPLQNLMSRDAHGGPGDLGTNGTFYYLSGMEGYNVGSNQVPDTQQAFIIQKGRNLNAGDAGQNNVLLNYNLFRLKPLNGHIHVGSTITFTSPDGKIIKTVTVVGFYASKSGFLGTNVEPILATTDAVTTFTPPGQAEEIFYLKVDSSQVGKALNIIGSAAPNANVFNLASIGDFINQFINDILLVLITIASLSLLAGIIIIANAVALAMLERRRELGILKSVGYTSRSILSEVLIENGIVGGTGALLAMVLVTLATSLLNVLVFKSSNFGVNGILVLILIVGIAVLAMITSALVAWGAVRVRPLEVLRYE